MENFGWSIWQNTGSCWLISSSIGSFYLYLVIFLYEYGHNFASFFSCFTIRSMKKIIQAITEWLTYHHQLLENIKGLTQDRVMNIFHKSFSKTWINRSSSIYSTIKMPLFLFSANESHCFIRIWWYIYIDEHTLNLTSVKIDHPKMASICISWKRDFIFKLQYLQELLLDLSDWGLKF